MKDNPVKQIVDAKQITLEDNDILFVTYDKYDPDYLIETLNDFLEEYKEKKITCIYLPEDVKITAMKKEDAIERLEYSIQQTEQMIEKLKNEKR